ncbi:hypothetical protein [Streptomyces sp. NPDC059564]|uniref:hypothetical protein n=1 Tax=Streptomyces sp. NPDC059564 TaxID=3346865 RepID=UPI00369F1CB5
MRPWIRAVPAAVGAVALAAALTGCNNPVSAVKAKSSAPAAEKKTYGLGEASPLKDSNRTTSDGAKFTVTPTRVETGTQADMDNSGLKKDEAEGPEIPVFVWTTLTHKSGPAMELGDMDDDLVMRTDTGQRTKALFVFMGRAKWPNCPSAESGKKLTPGQSEQICTAFLIPANQKAAAVELTRGFYKEPLEWPVKN